MQGWISAANAVRECDASSMPAGFVVKECDATIDHDGSGYFTYWSVDGRKFAREMQENEKQSVRANMGSHLDDWWKERASVRAHVGTHLADWLTESGRFVRP